MSIIFFLVIINYNSASQISFPYNSDFRYIEGNQAAGLEATWINPGFVDSAWKTGKAPFRYTDGTGGTVLSTMRNTYSCIYMRSVFSASNVENIQKLNLTLNYDDGFILWINGQQIISKNAPVVITPTSLATTEHESGNPETFAVNIDSDLLVEGQNCLALQVFNVLISSSDFYIDLLINAQPELPVFPDSVNVLFSKKAGFYTDSFNLSLSSPNNEYPILYTLDGSNPQTSPTSIKVTSPYSLVVNPLSKINRPVTPCVIVRASLVEEGYKPSHPKTCTYIFQEKVNKQSYPGGGWPQYSANGQSIDLDIDQDVINNNAYKDLINDAFLQVPSISVVTDLDNLFSSSSGIYVNAKKHGEEWEKPCSIELMSNDTNYGFQINAGLRIRGGNSRDEGNPKHAFRVFFRKEYGAAKLKFQLFGELGATEFDKIDLRTEQNYSWSMDGSEHNTFVRDIFSRDLQRDFNQPYSRGDYCHLYLNGMYWGLFQTEERPEAAYASSYFGDSQSDYDVIKVDVSDWPYFNEATSGDMEAWTSLWNMCKKGFSTNSNYFSLIGKSANGMPDANSRVMVDIDNLIDYMLVIFYTGNVDAPVSAWHSNDMPNNYFAIFNKKDKGKGFVFIAHDSEHSMFVDPIFVNDGLNENRVTIDDPPMVASGILNFQPQWLHDKLTDNAEYRRRFSDRAYNYLNMNGPLTPNACKARFKARADEIDLAIIAESARWGDSRSGTSLTRDDDWVPEINSVLNDFIPYRSSILVGQLKEAGLYSSIEPPIVKQSGILLNSNRVKFESQTTISLETTISSAQIYYTIDGTDPRSIDDVISARALDAGVQKEFALTGSAKIMTRTYKNGSWSALRTIIATKNIEDYSHLKITEINYHPDQLIKNNDTIDSKDLEFIELKNTGTDAINISGIEIDSAVYLKIPENTILAPGEFYVAASKPEYFYSRYGMYPSGNFSGNLSNSGEFLLINDPAGNVIFSLVYSDNTPWPTEADGDGYSLAPNLFNPTGDPNSDDYWRKSRNIGGSPFADDLEIVGIDSPVSQEIKINLYPNPVTDIVNITIDKVEISLNAMLNISDLNGKSIYNNWATVPARISLSELGISPGIYMIRITTDKLSLTKKLIYLRSGQAD